MILLGHGQTTEADLLNDPHVGALLEVPDNLPPEALFVHIHREMFSDFFNLTLPNGHTEEIHYEDIREFFKDRNADMSACEKALDHAWNFQHADFIILKPVSPIKDRGRHTPKL